MTNFTRGPWSSCVRIGLPAVKSDAEGGVSVAFCGTNSAFIPGGRKVISQEEAKANARLIAAAPDLLEALQTLESSYAAFCDGTLNESPERALVQARAAIAKATGAMT